VLAAALLAGCASAPHRTAAIGQSTTTSNLVPPPTTTAPTTTTTAVASFSSGVATVSAAQLGATWHTGCPVDPSQLRLLELTYWGFDNQSHVGSMVVNASEVDSVIRVFSTLYADRFPIEEMVPEATYGGDDNAAAAADDTSGFNCRFAVAAGPPQWSMHAYGEAIDVNDVQNPYVDGATVIPTAGAPYEARADVRPGMATPGGTLVDAFASVGWQWGGAWATTPDYQHFSVNGK
jgi:hypothetical protein